jgi:hypothetical protein
MRQRQLPELGFEPRLEAGAPISLASAYLVRVAGTPLHCGVRWSAIICIASDNHISYIYTYATAIFIFKFITAETSGHNFDPMRWRGSSADHVCWRRSAVRWAWGRTGQLRHAPAITPSPSEPGPSLHLRPLNGAPSAHPKAGQRESKLVGEVGVCAKALQQQTGLVSTARCPDPGLAHNFGLHSWIGDGRGE